jgi:hypothetical protein
MTTLAITVKGRLGKLSMPHRSSLALGWEASILETDPLPGLDWRCFVRAAVTSSGYVTVYRRRSNHGLFLWQLVFEFTSKLVYVRGFTK